MDQAQRNGLALLLNNVDPKVITINLAEHEQRMKVMRAERDAANPQPGKAADLRKEYNTLRQRLFSLKQDAHCFEIRTNEAAGKIRNIQQRIDDVLRLKKEAAAMGNLRGERTYEQSIERLETELGDAEQEFAQNKRWNTQAARALKDFDGHARIEELKAILDSPVAKSDSVPK